MPFRTYVYASTIYNLWTLPSSLLRLRYCERLFGSSVEFGAIVRVLPVGIGRTIGRLGYEGHGLRGFTVSLGIMGHGWRHKGEYAGYVCCTELALQTGPSSRSIYGSFCQSVP